MAVAFRQSASATASGATSISITLPMAVVSGSLIATHLESYSFAPGSGVPNSITDSSGNTYSSAFTPFGSAAGVFASALLTNGNYAQNVPASSSLTVTYGYSASNAAITMVAWELTGVVTSGSPLGLVATGQPGSGSNPSLSVTGTSTVGSLFTTSVSEQSNGTTVSQASATGITFAGTSDFADNSKDISHGAATSGTVTNPTISWTYGTSINGYNATFVEYLPAGGTTHTSTGSLIGAKSRLTGASSRTHAHGSTGAFRSSASRLTGASARTRPHATTGVLTGKRSVIIGASSRTHVHSASGVLLGKRSNLTAAAKRFRAHNVIGTLASAGSKLAGSAARRAIHATVGALVGAASALVGVAARSGALVTHAATGALRGAGALLRAIAERTEEPNVFISVFAFMPRRPVAAFGAVDDSSLAVLENIDASAYGYGLISDQAMAAFGGMSDIVAVEGEFL